MTEKQCQLTDKLRNYVYRYGVELSDENLKKMGEAAYKHVKENFQFDRYYGVVEEIRKRQKECEKQWGKR